MKESNNSPYQNSGSHYNKKSYGLPTTIAMIVGIVVGSGIYFRADDVLLYTEGNLLLGILILALGAICIIFGSLTLSKLSYHCSSSGGIVAYFEEFLDTKIAAGFGWFQLFAYFPPITIIISWVAVRYMLMLFQIEISLSMQILFGLLLAFFLTFINTINKKLGGYLQNIATAIKILPLLFIAVSGVFFVSPLSSEQIGTFTFASQFSKGTWLSALVPLAYSYDGWTVAMNIAPEVKNPKKNMTLALILSPLIILFVYLCYFYGVSSILTPGKVIELGDEAVFVAGRTLLGERMGNIFLIAIIISVLGVLNGLTLASIRFPQAMAEKGMFPDYGISKISDKFNISIKSSLLYCATLVIWAILHYLVMTYDIFNGHDVSEISIVYNYLCYILLYITVFKLDKVIDGEKSHKILAALAIFGSLMIFIGSLFAQPVTVILFIAMCSIISLAGILYYSKNINKKS